MPPDDPWVTMRMFRLGQLLVTHGDEGEGRMWLDKAEPGLKADPVEYAERLEWLADWRKKHP